MTSDRATLQIPTVNTMKSLVACSLLILATLSCCVSAANTTDDGTTLNATETADTTTRHRYCPLTCFCDFDSSLVSCAGTEDEPIDVIWVNSSLSNNTATVVAIPTDVWSVVAARDIQRLDVHDLVLERLDDSLLNGTERLNELSLVRCGLNFIGNGTFTHHSNLERLDLSQNQLTILSQV